MADTEHVKVFHRGVDAWNRWRRQHRGVQPDLSRADLRKSNLRLGNLNNANLRFANLEGANLGRAYLESAELEGAQQHGAHLFGADLGRADLRGADLSEAQLWDARLMEADLRGADLRATDLRHSDLSGADLEGADLEKAVLDSVFLFGVNLAGANLNGARLHRTQVWDCRLAGADFSGAMMAHTALNHVDLSRCEGLDKVEHDEPSSLGVDTLERTASGLTRDRGRLAAVDAFLRGAGVRESYLDVFHQRITHSFGFYSAFIRYSHADRGFARRLYDELQVHGVRCWLHEHPMLPGDDAHEEQALGRWDRLVVLTSEAALTSWWIESEISHALDGDGDVMIPVNLDAYLTSDRWGSADSRRIRSLLAADFSAAPAPGPAFEREIARVVDALRVES